MMKTSSFQREANLVDLNGTHKPDGLNVHQVEKEMQAFL